MKKIVIRLLMLPIVVLTSFAHADGLSFRFSPDAISVFYNIYPIRDRASAEFGWVHNNDRRDVVTVGFFANGQREQLTGRLGAKAYWAKIEDNGGGGLAFGGDFSFQINEIFSLFGRAYWGPNTVAFGEIDGYEEWQVGANIQVFDNSIVALSYGSLDIDTDRYGKVTVDEGLALGLKMNF